MTDTLAAQFGALVVFGEHRYLLDTLSLPLYFSNLVVFLFCFLPCLLRCDEVQILRTVASVRQRVLYTGAHRLFHLGAGPRGLRAARILVLTCLADPLFCLSLLQFVPG